MIIHISGAPGSGKTTIGKWAKKNFKNLKVYDIDTIYYFIINKKEKQQEDINKVRKTLATDLQQYINKMIGRSKNTNTNLMFVGLNYPDPRIEYLGKEQFVKPFKIIIDSDYKIYIDIPANTITKQKLKRTLKEAIDDIDGIFDDIIKNKKKFFKINLDEWTKESEYWKKIFTKEGYKMMDPEKIKNFLVGLLSM